MNIELICSIIAGLAICVPALVTMVKYIVLLFQEKQWKVLLQILFKLIAEAETLFNTGAEKKEWVMETVKTLADESGIEIDETAVSTLVDDLVKLTKRVNV